MRTKKRIIREQQELIDQLQLRLSQQEAAIVQLQTSVTDYRSREQSIANAMTEAAELRRRICTDAEKDASTLRTEAETERRQAHQESETLIEAAYQNARDIVKEANAESRKKLEQTEAAINTYSEVLHQYNTMVLDHAKTAEENARRYAEFYRQMQFSVPDLLGETADLGSLPDAPDVSVGEIGDDPAKLMRNIYTIEKRDLPVTDVPDRTSCEQEPACDGAAQADAAEETPVCAGDTGAACLTDEPAPEAEPACASQPAAEEAGAAGGPSTEDANDTGEPEDEADAGEPAGEDGAEELPPSVSELVSDEAAGDDAVELDRLLDDIINAAG